MPILEREAVERQLPFGRRDFDLDSDAWEQLLEGDETTSGLLDRETGRIMDWVNERGNETAFELTEGDDTIDGTGTDELPLPKRPVQDVESVTVETRTRTHELVVGDDVVFEETHLALLPSAPIRQFPDRRRSVTVAWTFGYDNVPGPVEEAFVRLVRSAIDQIATDGLAQESVGDGSYTYRPPQELRAEVVTTIREYRPPSYYGGSQVI